MQTEGSWYSLELLSGLKWMWSWNQGEWYLEVPLLTALLLHSKVFCWDQQGEEVVQPQRGCTIQSDHQEKVCAWVNLSEKRETTKHSSRDCFSPNACKKQSDEATVIPMEQPGHGHGMPGILFLAYHRPALRLWPPPPLVFSTLPTVFCIITLEAHRRFFLWIRGSARMCTTHWGLSLQWQNKLYCVKFLEQWQWKSFLP